MNYCGIVRGKKSSHFHIVYGERQTVTAGKFANNVDAIRMVFANRPSMRTVVEASCRSLRMADRLKELGDEVVVVDPGRRKASGVVRIKHDKLDARILADLCQTPLWKSLVPGTLEANTVRMYYGGQGRPVSGPAFRRYQCHVAK